jgi:hypothetical protein
MQGFCLLRFPNLLSFAFGIGVICCLTLLLLRLPQTFLLVNEQPNCQSEFGSLTILPFAIATFSKCKAFAFGVSVIYTDAFAPFPSFTLLLLLQTFLLVNDCQSEFGFPTVLPFPFPTFAKCKACVSLIFCRLLLAFASSIVLHFRFYVLCFWHLRHLLSYTFAPSFFE